MEPVPPSSGSDRTGGTKSVSHRLRPLAGAVALLIVGMAAYALTRGGNEVSLNPIAQAAVRTEHMPGGRASFRGTVDVHSLSRPLEMSGSGVFNGTTNRGRLRMTISTPSGRQIDMDNVADGAHVYMRSRQLKAGLPDGDKWTGVDMSLGSPSEADALASASPAGQLAYLRAVSDRFEKLGEKKVHGIETTGYRSVVDPDRFVEYARGKGSLKAAEEYEQLTKAAPSTTEVETWIDHRDLIRQMTLKVDSHDPSSGQETTMEMTADFSHFGISPEIKLPDPDTVYDATDEVRSKVGLGGSS